MGKTAEILAVLLEFIKTENLWIWRSMMRKIVMLVVVLCLVLPSALLTFPEQAIAGCAFYENQTIMQAYQEGMGRSPRTDEIEYWCNYYRSNPKNANSYKVVIGGIRSWFQGSQGRKDVVETINRSYGNVFLRSPHKGELEFWIPETQLKGFIYKDLNGFLLDWANDHGYQCDRFRKVPVCYNVQ